MLAPELAVPLKLVPFAASLPFQSRIFPALLPLRSEETRVVEMISSPLDEMLLALVADDIVMVIVCNGPEAAGAGKNNHLDGGVILRTPPKTTDQSQWCCL